jgi:hypothetical protein
MWGLLILLVAATASAQPPKTIFPSDSQDPKQSGGAALLEAVCPGARRRGQGNPMPSSLPRVIGLCRGKL